MNVWAKFGLGSFIDYRKAASSSYSAVGLLGERNPFKCCWWGDLHDAGLLGIALSDLGEITGDGTMTLYSTCLFLLSTSIFK